MAAALSATRLMKAKAASKSTNWNFRVMASRPSTSFQSGSRFSAARNSSIFSFAMERLQRIILFNPIDAAIAGQLAGIETKRINRKFGAGVKRVVGQPFQYLGAFRMPEPRQRHMRDEFVLILRLADAADGAVHLALQMLQRLVLAHPRPQGMNLFSAELPYGVKLEIEGWGADIRQGIVQHGRIAPVHFADEAQCQVQLLALLPMRAW